MAAFVHDLYWRRQLRRNRVFRDHLNPLDTYDDVQLFERFRFRRADLFRIVDEVRGDLEFGYRRKGFLSPELQVLVALRFFASGSFQIVVGDTILTHKSTTSRTIHRVSQALCARGQRWVHFPRQREANRQKRLFYAMASFPNVIGCVDGTHVKLQAPVLNEHEYVNRSGKHSINVHLICDAELRILNFVVKYPGSAHDARILREGSVWRAFEGNRRPLDGCILGDSAYPLREWLLTPFLNPQTPPEVAYTRAFVSTRVTIERCNGVLKRRFHCLHSELRYSPERACKIITACLVLHNMAIEFGTPAPDPQDDNNDNDDDDNTVCNDNPTLSGRAMRQRIVQQHFTRQVFFIALYSVSVGVTYFISKLTECACSNKISDKCIKKNRLPPKIY